MRCSLPLSSLLTSITLATLRLKRIPARATPESRPTARLWVNTVTTTVRSITEVSLLGMRRMLRIESQLAVLMAIITITPTRVAMGI